MGKFRSWSTLGKDIKSEGIAVPLSEKPDAFFHAQRDFFGSCCVLSVAAGGTAVVANLLLPLVNRLHAPSAGCYSPSDGCYSPSAGCYSPSRPAHVACLSSADGSSRGAATPTPITQRASRRAARVSVALLILLSFLAFLPLKPNVVHPHILVCKKFAV